MHFIEYTDSVRNYHEIVEDSATNINYTITALTPNVQYNISVRVGMATSYGYVFSGPSGSVAAVSMPTTGKE